MKKFIIIFVVLLLLIGGYSFFLFSEGRASLSLEQWSKGAEDIFIDLGKKKESSVKEDRETNYNTKNEPQGSGGSGNITNETADWKTYQNGEYNFSFLYPNEWELINNKVLYGEKTDTIVSIRDPQAIAPLEFPQKISFGVTSYFGSLDEFIADRVQADLDRWDEQCDVTMFAERNAMKCPTFGGFTYYFKVGSSKIFWVSNKSASYAFEEGVPEDILSTFEFK